MPITLKPAEPAAPAATTSHADLEDEDFFEEFDLDTCAGEKMEVEDTKEEDDEEIFGEAEKWDDDDIEEDFSSILKHELKISETADDFDIDVITRQELAAREEKRTKRKERQEALAERELEILSKDKELDQRKKVHINYSLEPVEVKKVPERRRAKRKETENVVVIDYFNELLSSIPADDRPTLEHSKEKFLDDLKPIIPKIILLPFSVQRETLSDKEKELKRKEKFLDAQYERYLKVRRNHVSKLLSAMATEEEVNKKEAEELQKAVKARQTKRRHAALIIALDKAVNMSDVKKEDMDKTVLHIAQALARTEGLEEKIVLKEEKTWEGEDIKKNAKCLPYKSVAGDDIDKAVGKELTEAKLNCPISRCKDKSLHSSNTTRYSLFTDKASTIKVKVVNKIVLASSEDSNGEWSLFTEFLQSKTS